MYSTKLIFGWIVAVAMIHSFCSDSEFASAAQPNHVKVMSFNIWVGGEAGGAPLAQTVKVIEQSGADIVGLQETHGRSDGDGRRRDNAKEIADQLGWHHVDQGRRNAIISRYPIEATTPQKHGATIHLGNESRVEFFNIHFAASPYQPYQILQIPYGNAPFIKTENEAIEWANRSRGKQVESLLQELAESLKSGRVVVLTGDFNEPSFQDWTTRNCQAGGCPLKVVYPATKRIADAGMIDSYRHVYPDEIDKPGFTWTPITSVGDPKDRHDRIDFVFVGRSRAKIVHSMVVGESRKNAGLVINPWPSDHRAVLTHLLIDQ